MADISITQTQLSPINKPSGGIQTGNHTNIKAFDTPEISKEDSKAAEERRKKLREELLENVISVSEDGDTVQVSDDGADKLINTSDQADIYEEEIPTNQDKPDSYSVEMTSSSGKEEKKIDIDEADDAIDKTFLDDDYEEDSPTTNITSFKGYTDTQLEQMYLNGEISKYNYDREMDARQAQEEELEDNNEDTSKQVMATVSGMERVYQDAAQIKQAFAEDSIATPDAANRIEIMSTLQDLTKLQ